MLKEREKETQIPRANEIEMKREDEAQELAKKLQV
jgi:hypothetical protein